jgi:hypothetical protein
MFFFWFFWLVLAIVVGSLASSRGRSGFGYFLLALVMTPLVGFAILLALNNKAEEARQEQLRREDHERHLESIKALTSTTSGNEAVPSSANTHKPVSISDELEKLATLRDKGILSDEEFQQQKSILLNHTASSPKT